MQPAHQIQGQMSAGRWDTRIKWLRPAIYHGRCSKSLGK